MDHKVPLMEDADKRGLLKSIFEPQAFGSDGADGITIGGWFMGTADECEKLMPKFRKCIDDHPDFRQAQGRIFCKNFEGISDQMPQALLSQLGGEKLQGLGTFGRPVFCAQGNWSTRIDRGANPCSGFPQFISVVSGEIVVGTYNIQAFADKGI